MAQDNVALVIGLPLLGTLALYAWTAASLSAVFRKAGEPGWQAWVPVLNLVVLLRLARLSPWWVLLLLVPGIGAVALAVIVWIACHRINAEFGVGTGMTVLAVIVFPVWSSILGWGSARWLGADRSVTGAGTEGADLDGRVGVAASPAIVTPAVSGDGSAERPPGARRRGASILSEVPGGAPGAEDMPVAARGGVFAPYTGTLPSIDSEVRDVPAGPRRAVPAPAVDDHYETHDARRALAHAPEPPVHRDPWAPPAAPAGRDPRYSPGPAETGVSESSDEVSAVSAAPSLGAPMPARSSVSALRDEPELPDAPGAFDETVVATRRRTAWTLIPPLGAPIPVTSSVVIVGRRPNADPAFAQAQLVPVIDETRTMSKTHARLELGEDSWTIVDLDSTNGVVLVRPDGHEVELMPGRPELATESFYLGDAELRLSRSPGVAGVTRE